MIICSFANVCHDVQVIVGYHLKNPKHLIKHFAMLTRDTDDNFEIVRILLELLYQRTHLDSLGTSTKDEHYSLHRLFVCIKALYLSNTERDLLLLQLRLVSHILW